RPPRPGPRAPPPARAGRRARPPRGPRPRRRTALCARADASRRAAARASPLPRDPLPMEVQVADVATRAGPDLKLESVAIAPPVLRGPRRVHERERAVTPRVVERRVDPPSPLLGDVRRRGDLEHDRERAEVALREHARQQRDVVAAHELGRILAQDVDRTTEPFQSADLVGPDEAL